MAEEIRDEETLQPQEETETPEKPEEPLEELLKTELASSKELEEKNKKLFARAKKAEEKAKRLEAELFVLRQQQEKTKETSVSSPDIADLTKKISALKDFSPEEIDYISLISRAKNLPLEEAVKTDEVQLYIKARREKVAQESKVPEPSTKQVPSVKDFSEWTEEDVRNASLEDLEKFRDWIKQQRKPVK